MPKVPELNVRREPSVRVGQEQTPTITSNATKLRRLGGQFLQIGEQIEKAKNSYEILNSSAKAEDSWSGSAEDFEKLIGGISNGDIDPEEGLKQGSKLLEKEYAFQQGLIATSKNTKEVEANIKQFVAPSLEKARNKLDLTVNKTRVSNDESRIQADASKMSEMLKSGLAGKEDIDNFFLKMSTKERDTLHGKTKIDKYLAGAQRSFAGAAINNISRNGATQENIDLAKSLIANTSDAEKLFLERTLEDTVQQTKKIEKKQNLKNARQIVDSLSTPQAWEQNAQKINTIIGSLANTEITATDLKETQQIFGDLVGKQISASVKLANPDMDLFMVSPELINEEASKIARGLAGTPLAESFGTEEDLTNFIASKSFGEFKTQDAQRLADPVGYYSNIDPSIKEALLSGNALMVEQGVEKLEARGVKEIFDKETIKQTTEEVNNFIKKGFDPTGEKFREKIFNLTKGFGERSPKVLKELVQKKAMPAVVVPVSRISNESLQLDILSTMNNYDSAVNNLKEQGLITSKANLEKQINFSINSNFDEINIIGGGDFAQTKAMQTGLRESVRMLAIKRLMDSKGGIGIDEATTQAIDEIKKEFTVATSGISSVVVDREYARKNNIEFDNMDKVVKSMQSLEYIDQVGIDLDYSQLSKEFETNSYLTSQLAPVLAERDPAKQRKKFVERFGDLIIIDSDPNQANVAKVYIKDDKLRKIPLTVVKPNGNLGPMQIDVGKYASAQAKGDIDKSNKSYAEWEKMLKGFAGAKEPMERKAAREAYLKARNTRFTSRVLEGLGEISKQLQNTTGLKFKKEDRTLIRQAIQKASEEDLSKIIPDSLGAFIEGSVALPVEAGKDILEWARNVGVKGKK